MPRFGTVAILGRANVGKSTFLNAALGERLAIVSPLPQTTRDTLLGVVHREGIQIAFVDTPGLHRPRTELGRRMNASAEEAARSTDVVVLMTDVEPLLASRERAIVTPSSLEDVERCRAFPPDTPVIVVINKIDLLRDKARLLPMIAAFTDARPTCTVIPTSALSTDGVERVLTAVSELLPEGPPGYDPSTLTDRPSRFFAREYVREQILLSTEGEVPHAVAVTIDEYSESTRAVVVKATIHVEKAGQRAILVGRAGAKIKEIGTGARLRLEELVGRKVHLSLFVRVTPHWKALASQLAELGYEGSGAGPTGAGPTDDEGSR
jgi:GTP-binding protein Era